MFVQRVHTSTLLAGPQSLGGPRPIRQAIAATLPNFNLLRQLQGVVYLDAEIADCALQLALAEQQLAGA